ncbi:MAG TPA: hypothetical protein VKF36_04765 [Syntrophorhabdales bacterium]|nr:hypothetical protein [Syntrophorhabdales bacterium]
MDGQTGKVTRVDTRTLTDNINQCFTLSATGGISPQQQAAFLADGKRLRGLLLNLLSAEFDENTPKLLDANKKLQEVNAQLLNSADVLSKTAGVLKNMADLIGILDGLLGVAAKFI